MIRTDLRPTGDSVPKHFRTQHCVQTRTSIEAKRGPRFQNRSSKWESGLKRSLGRSACPQSWRAYPCFSIALRDPSIYLLTTCASYAMLGCFRCAVVAEPAQLFEIQKTGPPGRRSVEPGGSERESFASSMTRSDARHIEAVASQEDPCARNSNRNNSGNRNRRNSPHFNNLIFSNRNKIGGSDDATSIVTLSDQRESKGLSSSLIISNLQCCRLETLLTPFPSTRTRFLIGSAQRPNHSFHAT